MLAPTSLLKRLLLGRPFRSDRLCETLLSKPRSPPATWAAPEYVVGSWWANLLHNQSALRLKGRLLFEQGVMVINVPWQLRATANRDLDRIDHTPGDVRRGPASTPRE